MAPCSTDELYEPQRFDSLRRRTARMIKPFIGLLLLAGFYGLLCLPFLGKTLLESLATAPSILQDYYPVSRPEIYEGSSTRQVTLGVADKIYVISLATRKDRRADMEHLRRHLGLAWAYIDATPSHTPIVMSILEAVRVIRQTFGFPQPVIAPGEDHGDLNDTMDGTPVSDPQQSTKFAWPSDIDQMASSTAPIDLWGEAGWPGRLVPMQATSSKVDPQPLLSATHDFSAPADNVTEHKILSPSRVGCWYSHMTLIHSIANTNVDFGRHGATLILEDDVDMERDIHKDLRYLWPFLPSDWDIVFLGHCWSNESFYPPISSVYRHDSGRLVTLTSTQSPPFFNISSRRHQLHPSRSPKCTHAYVLSHTGARRLLLHLRHPLFAYSRAIDQAFSWLVESGRLKSFSVVPSLVVQRKVRKSDVMNGVGSAWRESLVNGVFPVGKPERRDGVSSIA
ncbi:hypothetical protein FA15DRAFT_753526 [Coprinopsis marcescibilis]|uniref:Glycosyl transferase family 25 domain-containing protein n=1 Tax=Coprinopsis marcescibilis TaxID=230819 RepID=A0A5C3L6I3_COPMA|nr:hypothetical protein FA15DRAFT_753526 [Coprinopsis marcescibilis]